MEKLVPICVRLPRELYNKLKMHCAEKEKKMKLKNLVTGEEKALTLEEAIENIVGQ